MSNVSGFWAVIVAAGRGRRVGAGVNKVLLPLLGRPVVAWSLETFQRAPGIEGIVLVGGAGELEQLAEIVRRGGFDLVKSIVPGGERRQDSVQNGLAVVPAAAGVVLVHDGARPFVSPDLIARVVAAAAQWGAAVPLLPVADSLRLFTGDLVTGEAGREGVGRVQTPQGFQRQVLAQALEAAAGGGSGVGSVDGRALLTDESAAVMRAGLPVAAVAGDPVNLKITIADDYQLATTIACGRSEHRVGTGYDVHRLTPGLRLVLGGVEIPFELGLEGHSDADVVLHAMMDALLGALALGDIGRHFPPGDERFRGASSLDLLARVTELVRAAGAQVVNVDSMVIAERPKLAHHIPLMRERVAAVLGVDTSRVSVKATTNERLGFAGRGEGIAALATVMVRIPLPL